MSFSLLNDLNDSQRMAVEYIDGPSLVIAGAGSGKTRVLTYKIAYLLEKGLRPWSILALTFTNKAAREMQQRIARLVGEEQTKGLYMGTFHSIFSRILRREAPAIGYQPNYTIYDESDSRTLVKNIIKELGLDEKLYKPAVIHNIISLAKNRLVTPEKYVANREAMQADRNMRIPETYMVYTLYQNRCRQANAMDFDDLLLNTYLLFEHNEEIRKRYADHFAFVLVDEYQDTNYAQQCIVYQLTKERQMVCVVGDDAQSIYSFRGANIDNILNFRNLYNDAKLFKLERNYRSTQRIVNAANSLIRHNERQIQKDVYSRNEEGNKLLYLPVYTDKEEVMVVSQHIRRIMDEDHCGYADFAILYRTNAQSRAFEEQLRREGIPYRIYGGLSFYQRKEIKDIVAYFRLVVNPDDEEAFRRVINYPVRGIGNTTLDKIIFAAHNANTSLWNAISDPESVGLTLTKRTMEKVETFRQLILGFMSRKDKEDVYSLGEDIIKTSGIAQEIISDITVEGMARKENMEEFVNSMKDFVDSRREEGREGEISISDFLQEVALFTDLDSSDNSEERVSLMTVHSAKGLEFPTVFVVGLEENIFPSPMAAYEANGLEEERRLLYVAITRAEKHCILTNAKNRMRYGKMEFNPESRFLRDINRDFMQDESEFNRSRLQRLGITPRGGGQKGREQNSRPVATQFRADPKPRIVPHRDDAKPVNPFSEEFQRLQQAHGGRLRPVPKSSPKPTTDGSSASSISPSSSSSSTIDLKPGMMINHTRFGMGEIIDKTGEGDGLKITVRFQNLGTKQLLVKFARFTVL
ncbi:MAG: UvrD-helicase domain-containing protein [Prevotella sp.]|nr:UvrD-helicase domain-containing protein [Prevotella sp.]